jgi:hypothetical protein
MKVSANKLRLYSHFVTVLLLKFLTLLIKKLNIPKVKQVHINMGTWAGHGA